MSQANHNAEQDAPAKSAGSIIARNTIFGMGAQIALRIASFTFQVLIVRTLGGPEFGRYSIALAWAGLFSVIGDLGINQYLGREIARDRNKVNELFWDTVVLRFLLALIASVITTTGAALNGYDSRMVLAIAIYTSSYFLQAILAPLGSILMGNERVDVASVMAVVTQVLFMVFAAIFLILRLDFVWLVIASVINLPIVTGLIFWVIHKNKLDPPRFHINRAMWWTVLKAGFPFAFIQLSLSFAFQVDTILLNQFNISQEQVGWYNIAYNLTLTLLTLTRTFNDAILPTLAREHASNPDAVRPWYFRSVRVILTLGLPIAVGGMLLSSKLIGLLYQPEIAPAAIALSILVWDIPVVMYQSFCGNMTTSIKREHSAARVYGTLGVLNIALNILFIPRFGIVGSSFATVLTDSVGAIQYYFLFRREFGSGLEFKRLIRAVAAAGVMAVLIYLMSSFNILIVLVCAATVYLALVWFSGVFTVEERNQLVGVVTKRLPMRKQPVSP